MFFQRHRPTHSATARALVDRRELRAFIDETIANARGSDRGVGVLGLCIATTAGSPLVFDPAREDRMLATTLERTARALRQTDAIAVLARDELCIVLPNISGIEQAELAAVKLLRSIEGPLDAAANDAVDGRTELKVAVGITCSAIHGSSLAGFDCHRIRPSYMLRRTAIRPTSNATCGSMVS